MNLARVVAGVTLAAAAVLGTAGCGGDGPGAGEARLELDGRASISAPGKGAETVTKSRLVRTGETVTLMSGEATLELGGSDAELDLRPGTKIEVGRRPALIRGQLLASAPDRSLAIRADHATVTLGPVGAARLDRQLSLKVGSYRGGLRLSSAGRVLDVPALRQAAVAAAGVLPERAVPLVYSPADAWDRAYLGPAMRIGDQLLAYSRGFTLQLDPGQGTTPGFYRLVLPALARVQGYDGTLIDPARPPGETLVGAAITVKARGASFRSRWDEVFGFRQEGATWGLVALDQSLTESPLDVIRSLGVAIGRAPLLSRDPAATEGASTARPRSSTPSRTSPAAPRPSPSQPRPSPGPVPRPPSSGTPADPPAATVVDTVNDLLSQLPVKPPASAPITVTTRPPGSLVDEVLKVAVPPTTPPPVTVPPTTLPPVTVPLVTVPPVTVPPTTLPPVTAPQLTTPSTRLPGLGG